jgi:hypothetical protein
MNTLNTSDIAQEILQGFCAQHGLPWNIESNEHTIYQLATEHGLTVHLATHPEAGVFQAWVPLHPEVPEEKRRVFYATLLSANLNETLTAGGSLALDPEERGVIYQHAFDLRHATAEGFARFFATLTETAGYLQAAVQALVSGDGLENLAALDPNALRV